MERMVEASCNTIVIIDITKGVNEKVFNEIARSICLGKIELFDKITKIFFIKIIE